MNHCAVMERAETRWIKSHRMDIPEASTLCRYRRAVAGCRPVVRAISAASATVEHERFRSRDASPRPAACCSRAETPAQPSPELRGGPLLIAEPVQTPLVTGTVELGGDHVVDLHDALNAEIFSSDEA